MNIRPLPTPRRFRVGDIELMHVADVQLGNDELVTFRTESGTEYDVVRKPWGYYPLPSLNRRLPAHGLRPLLVRADDGRVSLLVCEGGHESELARYLSEHQLALLGWLDGDPCPMCGAFRLELWHRYTAPPEGETRFEMGDNAYERDLRRCAQCGHFVSRIDLELASLYAGDYVDATYGDRFGDAYDRVMALAPEKSDNAARVARIVVELGHSGSVLDVGSGLGVFPARIQNAGWTVTALDPDARACEHIRLRTAVRTIEADFLQTDLDSIGKFDLVTFNKVLEHVSDPVAMLAVSRHVLTPGGSVYIELPDGEAAAEEGPSREEFFVEHQHVYSAASFALLIRHAGFRARHLERVREPSSKYTLFAFCELATE